MFEIALMHLLTELVWKERQASFPAGYARWTVRLHVSQYCIVSEAIVGFMVSCWWYIAAQATAAVLLEVVVSSWVVGVVSRRGESDKSMPYESVLVGCVSVRSIVGAMEVSR